MKSRILLAALAAVAVFALCGEHTRVNGLGIGKTRTASHRQPPL